MSLVALAARNDAARLLALVAVLLSPLAHAAESRPATIAVQLLAINDFHGNLEPPLGSSGLVGTVPAGGAEYLASHIAALRATNPAHTFVVSAGDLVGASPLLSRLFHDQPTIEAMNLIGLDYNAVGNHEFDDGVAELRRLARGGCHPVDGCAGGHRYRGAVFRFLAANVVGGPKDKPLFKGFAVEELAHGVRLGFIGLTLEGTADIVAADGIRGWRFLDEADTINAAVRTLRGRGVEAIVVLIHQGGFPTAFDIDGCAGLGGPIVEIVSRLDPAVDLVLSGHTHQAYRCVIAGIPVTSAYSYGRLVTDVDLTLDTASGEVAGMTIDNTVVTRDVPKDDAVTALIARYDALAAPIANQPIGRLTADLLRAPNDAGEQALGDVVADAFLAATTAGGARLAFINPGGIRTDLRRGADGVVTYRDGFAVIPFGDTLVTLTLTGAQLERLLEEQFCGRNAPVNDGFAKVLLPSAGLHYTYRKAATGAADCDRADAVDAASITLDGAPVTPSGTYRVTVNDFLAGGGDGFRVLRTATEPAGGPVDLDAFVAYLRAAGDAGVGPPVPSRITAVPDYAP